MINHINTKNTTKIFINRNREIDNIRATIKKTTKEGKGIVINIFGIGRIGKTWLLDRLHLLLAQEKSYHIYHLDFRNLEEITLRTDSSDNEPVIETLPFPDCKKCSVADRTIQSLRQRLAIQTTDPHTQFQDLAIEDISSTELAKDFIQGLTKVAGGSIPVFLIDEVNTLERFSDDWARIIQEIILPAIRKVNAVFILAGRWQVKTNPTLSRLEDHSNRLPIPQTFHLGGFEKPHIDELVTNRLGGIDATANDHLVQLLMTYAGGSPGLCDELLMPYKTGKLSLSDIQDTSVLIDAIERWYDSEDVIPEESKKYVPLLKSMAVLRQLKAGIIDQFPFDKSIDVLEKQGTSLITEFLHSQIIYYDQDTGDYKLDEAMRRPYEVVLKETDKQRWTKLQQWAYEMYYNLTRTYNLEPINFLIEFWYHAMRLQEAGVSVNPKSRLETLKVKVTKRDNPIIFGPQAREKIIHALDSDPDLKRFTEENKVLIEWLNSFDLTQDTKQMEVQNMPTFTEPSSLQIEEPTDQTTYAKPVYLIGRQHEWQLISDAVHSRPYSMVIAIAGSGGIGKTDLVRRVIEESSKDTGFLIPISSNGGLFDFALSQLRDVEGLENAIIAGLRMAAGNPGAFDDYENNKASITARREEAILHNIFSDTPINDGESYAEWVDSYNKFVDNIDNRRILLCFDTVEQLSVNSTALRWLLSVMPRLRNTVIILSGRIDSDPERGKCSVDRLSEEIVFKTNDDTSNMNWHPNFEKRLVRIELKELEPTETEEYLRAIGFDPQTVSLERFYQASGGHPVTISLLAGLPERLRELTLRDIEDKAVYYKEKRKEMSEKKHGDMKAGREYQGEVTISGLDRQFAREKFEIISRRFVQRNREETTESLYDLLALARKGLTPELLASLEYGERADPTEVQHCVERLDKWQRDNAPLVKEYRETALSSSRVLVLHDVVFEMLAEHQKPFESFDPQKYLPNLVKYYHQELDRRRAFEFSEDVEALLLDTLYYNFLLDPQSAYCFLHRQVDWAIRCGFWSLVKRLHDEWEVLDADPLVKKMTGISVSSSEHASELEWVKGLVAAGEFTAARDKLVNLLNTDVYSWKEDGYTKILKDEIKNPKAKLVPDQLNLVPELWIQWSFVNLMTGNRPFADLTEAHRRLNAVIEFSSEQDGANETQRLTLADAYMMRSHLWQLQRSVTFAFEDLERAVEIYDQANVLPDEVRALCMLTLLSIEQHQLPQADQYATRAMILGKDMGRLSLARLISWKALAKIWYARGNLGRTQELLAKIEASPAKSNLPKWDLHMIYLELARAKGQAITQGLRIRDDELVQNIQDVDLMYRKAYKLKLSQVEQASIHSEWGNFYLHLATLHPDVGYQKTAGEIARSKLEEARNLLEAYPEGQEIRKAIVYLSLSKLALMRNDLDGEWGALDYLGQSQEQINRLEEQSKQRIRELRRSAKLVSELTVDDVCPELRMVKAHLDLMSGHLILKRGIENPLDICEALEHYQQAISLLNVAPAQGFVSAAFDEIWANLVQAVQTIDEIRSLVGQYLQDTAAHSPTSILREGIEQRCKIAALTGRV